MGNERRLGSETFVTGSIVLSATIWDTKGG